ncbi:winged helix-turn-helix domain-containing protein [Klebsiella sp. R445]
MLTPQSFIQGDSCIKETSLVSHIPICKIKSVIIDGGLVFRPQKNSLKDVGSGKTGHLNNVASQLLLYLLQNGSEVSTRDEVLLNVFQRNGARATDANLNQHISFIRKVITSIGHPAEVIVTVPRMGFKIGEFGINFQLLEAPENDKGLTVDAGNVKEHSRKTSRWAIGLTGLITSIAVLATYWWTWIPNNIPMIDVSVLRTIEWQQCHIHILGNASTDNITDKSAQDIFKDTGIAPDCSVKKDLYLNAWASNHDLINWKFAAECGRNNGYYYCHSQYHHREEWYED